MEKVEFYKIAIDLRKNEDEKRENLNSFYTNACLIVFSVASLIGTLGEKYSPKFFDILLFIPLLGIIIVMSWLFALKKINDALKKVEAYIDEIGKSIEQETNKLFKKLIDSRIIKTRITLSESLVPLAFLLIFFILLIKELV